LRPTLAEASLALPPRSFRVSGRRQETHDTWTLELEPVEGRPLEVEAGQFAMLYAFGAGEVPISVSGEPGGPLVHTVRAVGAVTEAICGSTIGAVLGIRGPLGNAWPIAAATGGDVVVVSGGIGLAPLRPVLYHVVARRREYRRVSLLYGSRTPADLLYTDDLDSWRDRIDVDVTVDAADESWQGKVGVVPKLIGTAEFDPASTHAFVCGPEIMMRFAAEALLERGVPPERIHVSMERNMQCGVGHCGHCQLGPTMICRDGPVYSYAEIEDLMAVRQL
jgi:anaerobic sulfite reductase subunit B